MICYASSEQKSCLVSNLDIGFMISLKATFEMLENGFYSDFMLKKSQRCQEFQFYYFISKIFVLHEWNYEYINYSKILPHKSLDLEERGQLSFVVQKIKNKIS